MTISLQDIIVDRDWQQIMAGQAAQRARLWSIVQLGMMSLAVLLSLVAVAFPGQSWYVDLRLLLTTSLLWMVPFWTTHTTGGQRRLIGSYGMLVIALIVALASNPLVPTRPPLLPAWFGGLVPFLTLPVLLIPLRTAPRQRGYFGALDAHSVSHLVTGLAAGLVLGFHMLLTARALPGVADSLRLPDLATWLWLLSLRVGLLSLGEEIFFRGLAYSLVLTEVDHNSARSLARIVLLNLLIYLIPVGQPVSPAVTAWIVIYGALMALVTTALRHQQKSLLPGLACNVVFHLFLSVLISS